MIYPIKDLTKIGVNSVYTGFIIKGINDVASVDKKIDSS